MYLCAFRDLQILSDLRQYMRRDSHCCDGVRDRLVWSGKREQLNTLASHDDRVKRSLILHQYDSNKSISQMVSRRPQLSRMSRWRRWYLDFRIWFGLQFLEQPPRPAHTQNDFKRYVVNIGLGQVLKIKSSPVEVAVGIERRNQSQVAACFATRSN